MVLRLKNEAKLHFRRRFHGFEKEHVKWSHSEALDAHSKMMTEGEIA